MTAYANKLKRTEAQVKELKKIIAKRNLVIHKLHLKLTDPVLVGALYMGLFTFYKKYFPDEKHAPTLIDYYVLLYARTKITFTSTEIQEVIDSLPEAIKSESHAYRTIATATLKHLKKLEFTKQYRRKKHITYMISSMGKAWLVEVSEHIQHVLLSAYKLDNIYGRKDKIKVRRRRR